MSFMKLTLTKFGVLIPQVKKKIIRHELFFCFKSAPLDLCGTSWHKSQVLSTYLAQQGIKVRSSNPIWHEPP